MSRLSWWRKHPRWNLFHQATILEKKCSEENLLFTNRIGRDWGCLVIVYAAWRVRVANVRANEIRECSSSQQMRWKYRQGSKRIAMFLAGWKNISPSRRCFSTPSRQANNDWATPILHFYLLKIEYSKGCRVIEGAVQWTSMWNKRSYIRLPLEFWGELESL